MANEPEPIWLRPARPQRDPRPSLSRAEITTAAIELADEHGLEAVSMRRIAAKLGVAAASLYWYVERKEDVYELMADEVIGEVELPRQSSGDWRADLRAIAHATRDVLRRHSWFMLLGIQGGLGPKTRRYSELTLPFLGGLGLDPGTSVNILAALNNYVAGFLHRETARERIKRRSRLTSEQWTERLEGLIERTAGADQDIAGIMAIRHQLHTDESFEFGLDCMLDGIAARIPKPS